MHLGSNELQPHSADIVRPLGTLEQFFWLVDQHRSFHFALAARIKGQTTIPTWRMALDALQQRHPLFSVRIEVGNGLAAHFRTVSNAPIPLRVVANPTQTSWRVEMAKELATGFQPQQAPLVRAVLLHESDECMFILTAHHSIADGISLMYAMRDVLRALSGEKVVRLPLRPAQESLLYISQKVCRDTHNPGQPAPKQNGKPIAFRTLDDSLPSIEALRLTPELTARLIELSRKEGTTVHGALCSALVLAGREISRDWRNAPVRVLSPFNLRKQLGIGEDCGVFVWAGIVPIEPRTSTGFWDIARSAKSCLTGTQSPEAMTLAMKGLDQALEAGLDVEAASQVLAQGFPSELTLTNLGNLRTQFDCGDLKLQALWGPAVLSGFHGQQTVGVTTTNGSLCLLHSSFAPIPSLLQRTEHILRSICEGYGSSPSFSTAA